MDQPDQQVARRHFDADLPEALGQSEAFLHFNEQLSRLAPVDRPLLIVGERGTGKELAAARLHFLSQRWEGPFVYVNCAALSETLLESELFGHEAGSFTGALRRRAGRFEAADGGTLFLDEIGQTPMHVQEKILRAVEYGQIQRIGSNEDVRVDARLVGATNADLPALVAQGRFKPDLLDRLTFEVLHVPPLRARGGDAVLLAQHFARRMAVELGRETSPDLGDDVARQLEQHNWPGNIRELKNAVERAVLWTDPEALELEPLNLDPFSNLQADSDAHTLSPHSPETDGETSSPADTPAASFEPQLSLPVDFKSWCEQREISVIRLALANARFNQKQAARQLGLSYHQFRGLYRKYQDHL